MFAMKERRQNHSRTQGAITWIATCLLVLAYVMEWITTLMFGSPMISPSWLLHVFVLGVLLNSNIWRLPQIGKFFSNNFNANLNTDEKNDDDRE